MLVCWGPKYRTRYRVLSSKVATIWPVTLLEEIPWWVQPSKGLSGYNKETWKNIIASFFTFYGSTIVERGKRYLVSTLELSSRDVSYSLSLKSRRCFTITASFKSQYFIEKTTWLLIVYCHFIYLASFVLLLSRVLFSLHNSESSTCRSIVEQFARAWKGLMAEKVHSFELLTLHNPIETACNIWFHQSVRYASYVTSRSSEAPLNNISPFRLKRLPEWSNPKRKVPLVTTTEETLNYVFLF